MYLYPRACAREHETLFWKSNNAQSEKCHMSPALKPHVHALVRARLSFSRTPGDSRRSVKNNLYRYFAFCDRWNLFRKIFEAEALKFWMSKVTISIILKKSALSVYLVYHRYCISKYRIFELQCIHLQKYFIRDLGFQHIIKLKNMKFWNGTNEMLFIFML